MRFPFAVRLIESVAPELGIKLELEPEFGFLGKLIFPDGREQWFKNTTLNINAAGAHEIARDKAYTKFVLRQKGLPVPEGKAFFSARFNRHLDVQQRTSLDSIRRYALDLGLPVFVKPNNKGLGEAVFKVYREQDLETAVLKVFEIDDVVLVERPAQGHDHRILVLNNELICAYQRSALSVTGDGRSSIQQLILAKVTELESGQRANARVDPYDLRIDLKLRELGLRRATVIEEGRQLALLDNANLSNGGQALDVSASIHPDFIAVAVQATQALGLRLAGVDLLCQNIQQPLAGQDWVILELNASPGLDHFHAMGPQQAAVVRQFYRKLLQAL